MRWRALGFARRPPLGPITQRHTTDRGLHSSEQASGSSRWCVEKSHAPQAPLVRGSRAAVLTGMQGISQKVLSGHTPLGRERASAAHNIPPLATSVQARITFWQGGEAWNLTKAPEGLQRIYVENGGGKRELDGCRYCLSC